MGEGLGLDSVKEKEDLCEDDGCRWAERGTTVRGFSSLIIMHCRNIDIDNIAPSYIAYEIFSLFFKH